MAARFPRCGGLRRRRISWPASRGGMAIRSGAIARHIYRGGAIVIGLAAMAAIASATTGTATAGSTTRRHYYHYPRRCRIVWTLGAAQDLPLSALARHHRIYW